MRRHVKVKLEPLRCLAISASVGAAAALLPASIQAQTVLPQGGSVASGQARIGTPSANALTVTQTSSRAVIDWNSFSVGQNGTVNFIQPNSSAAILNRVSGSAPSTIAGQITGNGQVYLVNPNGIAITSSGSVQVGGGFVGSTLDIANADFNVGRLTFSGKGASANVSNAGAISSAPRGFVGLIGGSVSNSGTINVPLGKVGLGSGEQATINPTGDGFLQVAIPTAAMAPNGRALIDVAGSIRAAGGSVAISAAAAQQAVRDTVNLSGTVSARSVSGGRGNIVLSGGAGGNVTVSGKLSASGGKRHNGGTIVVTGGNVRLAPTAKLDASGATGGNVLVGGDQKGGQDASTNLVQQPVAHAQTTVVEQGAVINANGTAGAGGNVVIWSDTATGFRGTVTATGARGDGGAVEVSSHGLLGYNGHVDVRSSNGRTGKLLLDPFDVTISSAPDTNVSLLSSIFSLLGMNSNISIASLTSALASANVTISTGSSGAQQGNITVASSLTLTGGNALTLSAANDIAINAPIFATGSGGLTLTAGHNIAVNGNIASTGGALNVNLNAAAGGAIAINSATIDTNGGNLNLSATQTGSNAAITLNNATLNLGGGIAALSGVSASGAGIRFSGTNSLTSGGAGSSTLTGTSTFGNGLQLDAGASLAISGDKTLSGASSSGSGLLLAAGSSLTLSGGNLTLFGNSSLSRGLDLLASSSIANVGTGILTLNATGGANLGGAISSVNGALAISGSGNIGQSGGVIIAPNLLLAGAGGNFSLSAAGNQIGTLAANAANVVVTSSSSLAVGNVLGTSGVTTTGNISLGTSGDLTVASGAMISGASPILAAAGNFINNAGSAAVTATSGRWLIYSNAPSGNIFGGLNSGSTAIWNAAYAALSPGGVSAAGNRYLFAFQPMLTFASTNAAKTYGNDVTGSIAGNYTVSGLQAGVPGAFLGDTVAGTFGGAPSLTSSGAAAAANVTGSPYAINIALGSLTSLANYLFAVQSNGGLTVNPALITVTPLGGSSVFGASPSNPGLSVTGLVNGQTVSVLTGLTSAFGITGTTGVGTYVLNIVGALTNPNYKLAGTNVALWTVLPLRGSLTDGLSAVIPGLAASAGLSVSIPAVGSISAALNSLINLSGKVNVGGDSGGGDGGGGGGGGTPGITTGPSPVSPILPAVPSAPAAPTPATPAVPGASGKPGSPVAGAGDSIRAGAGALAQGSFASPAASPAIPLAAVAPREALREAPAALPDPRAGCEDAGRLGCSARTLANKSGVFDAAYPKFSRDAPFKPIDRELPTQPAPEAVTAETLVKLAAGTSVVVTAGIVGWLLRGGALLGALLSSMPLWVQFDPLLVVMRPKRRDEDEPASEADLIFDNALRSPQGLAS